jgi:hypothetical protein
MAGRPRIAVAVRGPSHLPQGPLHHTSYLLDSGAAVSLLPYSSPLYPSGPAIVNTSGENIPSRNFVQKTLHFGSHCFSQKFLQAKVNKPISGIDFLSQIFFHRL